MGIEPTTLGSVILRAANCATKSLLLLGIELRFPAPQAGALNHYAITAFASVGNRTPGICLEGKYVTTTPQMHFFK